MNLLNRLFYFLGGFAIGIIILIFFLSGKKTSCDYGPNARTLKNIRAKKTEYSVEVMKLLVDKKIDSAQIISIFNNGTVIFSESDTKPDSCKSYLIEDDSNEKYIKIRVQNCKNTATVMEAFFEENPPID